MRAEGYNGQVEFDGQFVTILRQGVVARSTLGKGGKRIHVSQISAVQIKPATHMVRGFIQLTILGGVEGRSRSGRQTKDAMQDENTVVFSHKHQAAFEPLCAEIERAIANAHTPQPATGAPTSVADELGKLNELRAQGILSDAEFNAQKARLLN